MDIWRLKGPDLETLNAILQSLSLCLVTNLFRTLQIQFPTLSVHVYRVSCRPKPTNSALLHHEVIFSLSMVLPSTSRVSFMILSARLGGGWETDHRQTD